jgi:hypothetical protein
MASDECPIDNTKYSMMKGRAGTFAGSGDPAYSIPLANWLQLQRNLATALLNLFI